MRATYNPKKNQIEVNDINIRDELEILELLKDKYLRTNKHASCYFYNDTMWEVVNDIQKIIDHPYRDGESIYDAEIKNIFLKEEEELKPDLPEYNFDAFNEVTF